LRSTRALRVEGDSSSSRTLNGWSGFLSTPSGWRATCRISISCSAADGFLSTPSGWRATLFEQREVLVLRFLSTPSGWRATTPSQMPFSNEKFLSTPSGWRATKLHSVHYITLSNFYPRPPGGGRLIAWSLSTMLRVFLSTPSGWRATPAAFAFL